MAIAYIDKMKQENFKCADCILQDKSVEWLMSEAKKNVDSYNTGMKFDAKHKTLEIAKTLIINEIIWSILEKHCLKN